MIRSLSVLALLHLAGPASAQTMGRWHGEAAELRNGTQRTGWEVQVEGKPAAVSEGAAPFVYDPSLRTSRKNAGAWRLAPGDRLLLSAADEKIRRDLAGSFTIEILVKPDRPWQAPLLTRTGGQGEGVCGLQPVFFPQFGNQTYYGGFVIPPGRKKVHRTTGEYGSISMMRQDLDWLHLALVHDAENRTITWHTGYFMTARHRLEKPLTFTEAVLALGGAGRKFDFAGLIDEVRISKGALHPAEFLRPTAIPLENVSFASEGDLLPEDSGVVNVRHHFGAVGDGKVDDTEAIRAAFRAVQARHAPGGAHILFFPAGTYLVSGKVHWSRFLTVMGAGKDRTTIRLRDRCPGYDDPKRPEPVVVASSTMGPAGSARSVNGSSIANWLFGMTIDTGRGNPGVTALEFHANNIGAVVEVRLRSGDGGGVAGLDLTRRDCGPALYRNVDIEGFDYGVSLRTGSQEYSHTFENLTLKDQRVAGLENWSNIIGLRRVKSVNKVPALVSTGGNSMLTLLEGDFSGGAADAPAVVAAGAVYLRDVRTAGYGKALLQKRPRRDGKKFVEDPPREIAGPTIAEFVGGSIVGPGDKTPGGSLKLGIQEVPAIPWGDIRRDWVRVDDFKTDANDWADALEQALASGKPTVYLSRGGIAVSRPVRVPASVRRIFLTSGGIGRTKEAAKDMPILIVDKGDEPLVIEHGNVGLVEHAGPRTLVLQHGGYDYRAKAGAGNLFLLDVVGGSFRFVKGQHVWARQWNVEAHGDGPCIVNEGAVLWVLGFKTEYESEKYSGLPGSRAEFLSCFIYPLGKIPPDRPIFRVRDGDLAAIYGTSVYRSNHRVHILDERSGRTTAIDNSRLTWFGSRARMDLYVNR